MSYLECSSGVIPKALSSYLKTVDQNEPIAYQWRMLKLTFIQRRNFFPHAALLRQSSSLLCSLVYVCNFSAKDKLSHEWSFVQNIMQFWWFIWCFLLMYCLLLVENLWLWPDAYTWTCFWQKSTFALPATSSKTCQIHSHVNFFVGSKFLASSKRQLVVHWLFMHVHESNKAQLIRGC